ncbi:hypothetical protein A0H81_06204 [Grifola frondosa]|uniref:Peptidase A2 domain-containing protein n=1 Tax=Grifola frondosa TaxID=5627 RepID=A0A1C7MBA4_GRIFR|nr:hypothetical protein A0H81_06204 [Grifola frondosa]
MTTNATPETSRQTAIMGNEVDNPFLDFEPIDKNHFTNTPLVESPTSLERDRRSDRTRENLRNSQALAEPKDPEESKHTQRLAGSSRTGGPTRWDTPITEPLPYPAPTNAFHGLLVGVEALIDSGASENFIARRLVERYKVPTTVLPVPIKIGHVHRPSNQNERITEQVEGNLFLQGEKFPTRFYVYDLGPEELILGLPWIRKNGLKIDWENENMVIPDRNVRITRTTLAVGAQTITTQDETNYGDDYLWESDEGEPSLKKRKL